MSTKKCLNCDNELQAKYCCHCGQKADTHRITPKHFLTHDLLHGVFHIDKGILFTIKEALTRPGKAATDYIKGKRICYYNIFYLSLILIGFNIVLIHLSTKLIDAQEFIYADKDGVKLVDFIKTNVKYLILTFIPLFAFNALLLFRRSKYNFAEQHIFSGFALLGCIIIVLFYNFSSLLLFSSSFVLIRFILKMLTLISMIFYVGKIYVTAFKHLYTKMELAWRITVMYCLFFIETILLFSVILLLFSGGRFEGTIQFR